MPLSIFSACLLMLLCPSAVLCGSTEDPEDHKIGRFEDHKIGSTEDHRIGSIEDHTIDTTEDHMVDNDEDHMIGSTEDPEDDVPHFPEKLLMQQNPHPAQTARKPKEDPSLLISILDVNDDIDHKTDLDGESTGGYFTSTKETVNGSFTACGSFR